MNALLKRCMPGVFWKWQRTLKHRAAKLSRAVAERFGVVIASKGDYYSPLPSELELRRTRSRWAKPSAFLGVAYDLEIMKNHLRSLSDACYSEFATLEPFDSL